MQLTCDGAQLFPAALAAADLAALEAALASVPAEQAGTRLAGISHLSPLLARAGPVGRIAAGVLGPAARPVRALLFNKSAERNWALGWHQDRTICVRERVELAGFSRWTLKSDLLHVEPPFALLERMLTLRVHLDPVGASNAPLLIAPGSHRLGRIEEADIQDAVDRFGTRACLAGRGDVWLYATPILHASARAAEPAARRVLHVDYSADELPAGLAWSGV